MVLDEAQDERRRERLGDARGRERRVARDRPSRRHVGQPGAPPPDRAVREHDGRRDARHPVLRAEALEAGVELGTEHRRRARRAADAAGTASPRRLGLAEAPGCRLRRAAAGWRSAPAAGEAGRRGCDAGRRPRSARDLRWRALPGSDVGVGDARPGARAAATDRTRHRPSSSATRSASSGRRATRFTRDGCATCWPHDSARRSPVPSTDDRGSPTPRRCSARSASSPMARPSGDDPCRRRVPACSSSSCRPRSRPRRSS